MPIPKFWPMEDTMVAANFEFLDETGEPADPTTVIFLVRDPTGTVTEVAHEQLGDGLYRAEFIVDRSGIWIAHAEGQGALVVTDEIQFEVRTALVVLSD